MACEDERIPGPENDKPPGFPEGLHIVGSLIRRRGIKGPEYRLTAYFTHTYLERTDSQGKAVDGVCYPSVESPQTEDFGFNCIALRSEVLDRRRLRLSRVIEGIVYAGFNRTVIDNEKKAFVQGGEQIFTLLPVEAHERTGPERAEIMLKHANQ